MVEYCHYPVGGLARTDTAITPPFQLVLFVSRHEIYDGRCGCLSQHHECKILVACLPLDGVNLKTGAVSTSVWGGALDFLPFAVFAA